MRLYRYRGLLALLIWQAAPVTTTTDEAGRTRVSFGYGTGQYEDASFDCSGNLTGATPVSFQSGGVELEHWPDRNIRLQAFGGVVGDDSAMWNGLYGGGLGAVEWKYFGIGGGPVRLPPHGDILPSIYLRIGNIDKAHFRTEVLPPAATLGGTGSARFGVGFNQGPRPGVSGFGGIAICDLNCSQGTGGAAVELAIPLSSNFDLETRAMFGGGNRHTTWVLAAGGRYAFPRVRPPAAPPGSE